jgi:ubiquinol-cytochrome c reductase iron-sulfur subunit
MANVGVSDPVDLHGGEPVNQGRRRFLTATTAVVGAVGVGVAAVPFIKSWNPSARAKLAGAPITADISALGEGQRLVLEWRGQPIWIVKRSPAILQALPTLDSRLRDPKSENLDQQPSYIKGETRSIKPEPFDTEWKGGYFCPCHKSRFDMAGRVFQGVPAPTNLVVPPHYYENDTTIIIGVDPQGAA